VCACVAFVGLDNKHNENYNLHLCVRIAYVKNSAVTDFCFMLKNVFLDIVVGRKRVVTIATGMRPDQPWGQSSLLYKGDRDPSRE
jgi:hypothetical protein